MVHVRTILERSLMTLALSTVSVVGAGAFMAQDAVKGMWTAAEDKNWDGVKDVLQSMENKKKFPINRQNNDLNENATILQVAVSVGRADVVALILQYPQADLNELTGCGGLSPLMMATKSGYSEVVRLLLGDDRVFVNERGGYFPALALAAKDGFLDIVNMLLKHPGIQINRKTRECSPLALAAYWGRLDVVEALLAQEGIEHLVGTKFWENLKESYEFHKKLKERGELNEQDQQGEDLVCRYEKIIDLMEKADQQGKAWLRVVKESDAASLKTFIEESKPDLSYHNETGCTALDLAAKQGNLEKVRLLWSYPEIKRLYRDNEKMTALYRGADSSNKDLESFLKTMLNRRESLLKAAKTGDLDGVRRLVAEGADVNCFDLSGVTPLIHAVKAGNKEVIEYLLSLSDTDLYWESICDGSALHVAWSTARKLARDPMNAYELQYFQEIKAMLKQALDQRRQQQLEG